MQVEEVLWGFLITSMGVINLLLWSKLKRVDEDMLKMNTDIDKVNDKARRALDKVNEMEKNTIERFAEIKEIISILKQDILTSINELKEFIDEKYERKNY